MAAVTFSTSDGKKVKERGNGKKGKKGKRALGYVKSNSRTGRNTNKKNIYTKNINYKFEHFSLALLVENVNKIFNEKSEIIEKC